MDKIKRVIAMLENFKEDYDHVLMSDDLERIDDIIEVLGRP